MIKVKKKKKEKYAHDQVCSRHTAVCVAGILAAEATMAAEVEIGTAAENEKTAKMVTGPKTVETAVVRLVVTASVGVQLCR